MFAGPPDCSCTDFINRSGTGYCKKKYVCTYPSRPSCVKQFHNKKVCYVNQPSNCPDIFDSPAYKKSGRKVSHQACESMKGLKIDNNPHMAKVLC